MSYIEGSQYSLNWSDHMNYIRRTLAGLLAKNELVDITLCCEGGRLSAHKMLLSVCSQFFLETFKENPCPHPIIVLKGISYNVMNSLLKFIYDGEVQLDPSDLESFLEAAKLLQIHGLTDCHRVENIIKPHEEIKNEIQHDEISVNPSNLEIREIERISGEVNIDINSHSTTACNNTDTNILSQGESPKRFKLDETIKQETQDQSSLTSLHFHRCFSATASQIRRKEELPEEIIDSDPEIENRSQSEDKAKCDMCCKEFAHANSLRQHMKVHTEETKCPVCSKVLSRRYQLRLHMKMRHGIEMASTRRSAS